MTLNLPSAEMAYVEERAVECDMSKTAVVRQAIRLYQLVTERLKAGETMTFSGDRERIALFVGLEFPALSSTPAPIGSAREAPEDHHPGIRSETTDPTLNTQEGE